MGLIFSPDRIDMKKALGILLLVASITTLGYYTHRLWVFSGKVSDSIEYTYAALDCLIQESGQIENDISTLNSGGKIYRKRVFYNEDIPECKRFYSEFRCWELDPHNPKSLDGCGLHFGLTQEEIDTMKKDPSTIDKVMDTSWKRKEKDNK